jgi:hypothetical protein
VGQMVGNFRELEMININFLMAPDDDGDEPPSPDWETLTRVLPYLRRKVGLTSSSDFYDAEAEEVQGFAIAIHGHPMISDFTSDMDFTLGPWCSALVTLPSLERVTLGLQEPETEDELGLVNLEPLTELLRAPALRIVDFDAFSFTNVICHAVANALEEGSSITDIAFDSACSFPDGGRAIIANALKTNTSVTDVEFLGDFDEPFCNTLTTVLLCNSTLQNLVVHATTPANGRWVSSVYLSLGMNTTLKSLSVSMFDKFGDKLCAAIRSGLAKNSTLEELTLYDMFLSDNDGAALARNALSFLRTNSTLKSLKVCFVRDQKQSHISAFRLEALKMLENTVLERLTINTQCLFKFEELLALRFRASTEHNAEDSRT